ncbi:hypothetical protein BJAS_P3965 [Bathymodiolus japonicus methanotrophic gill symbiont]|uniref:hypothetical protein n=1 Tax=Bathymodiolus japonicus methanotrophic gill symbiont TaxID=113269 RepID=UPI001B712EAF|nr:hypothetical protein [Bathymodiolus japonicus methanotrophic gill symbiont]GFO73253.1 hypothetical protein BJAS_P3965 [Bathymodiolus japonicus methanotrophic gill symbiont]
MTPAETARLDICNVALTNIGSKPISSFRDDLNGSDNQNMCKLHYDKAFHSVLGEANWSFGLIPVTLPIVTPSMVRGGFHLDGWKNMYEYHDHFLKVISVYGKIDNEYQHQRHINESSHNQRNYTVQQRLFIDGTGTNTHHQSVILCDIEDAFALVLSKTTDISKTNGTFRDCVILKLSSYLALPLLGTQTPLNLIAQFNALYKQYLSKAWIEDVPNHYVPKAKESSFITCRY